MILEETIIHLTCDKQGVVAEAYHQRRPRVTYQFLAPNRTKAKQQARDAGWVFHPGTNNVTCPWCSQKKACHE